MPVQIDHKYPPPSMEAADQRIVQAKAIATEIEVKLEFKDANDFPGVPEYEQWRRRAMKALSYRRREINFLEQWLAQERRKSGTPVAQPVPVPPPQDITPLMVIAERMVRELRKRYVPRFSDAVPPPNMMAAQARLNELKGLNAAHGQRTSDLSLEATRLGFTPKQCRPARAVLDAFVKEVGVELIFVRSYITSVVQQDRSEPDWKDVCADALTRAVSEGFKLTEREQVVLDRLIRRKSAETKT